MDGKIKEGGKLGPPLRNLHIHSVNLGHERSRGGKGGICHVLSALHMLAPQNVQHRNMGLSWNQDTLV